jgi:hypothetical protein
MQASRTQLSIAAAAGGLLLVMFFGGLTWLNHQGPVLSRSVERDPLSGIPVSIRMNPLRDRSSERVAGEFIRSISDGHCSELLADWLHDYRKKYATFICDSEARHPLVAWKLAQWEDAPPLRILQYRGTRHNAPGDSATYKEILSVTLENRDGAWTVTKYDALY